MNLHYTLGYLNFCICISIVFQSTEPHGCDKGLENKYFIATYGQSPPIYGSYDTAVPRVLHLVFNS